MGIAERPEWHLYGDILHRDLKETGDRLGDFAIIDVISLTIFGALYQVKTVIGREDKLLHVFPKTLLPTPESAERLKETIERLRPVRDDGVLKAEKVVVLEDRIGILYEAFAGRTTVTRYLEKKAPGEGLEAVEVRRILDRVGQTLTTTGNLGVLHLTMNAEMVLVSPGGEPKIYGFGFLEAVDRNAFEIFVSGAIVPIQREEFAPGYSNLDVLSPELRNEDDYDVRSDLYTLGILGYYLLTHRRPIADWTLPSKAVNGLAEGWDFLISKCLEAEPKDRYPTWEAFLQDLKRVEDLHKEEPQRRDGNLFLRKLDRIPLPDRVKKRYSVRVQTYLRLAVLGIIGVLAVGTASLLYLLIFSDDGSAYEQTIFVAAPDQKPNLVLRLDPARARVKAIGEGGGQFVVENGELRLRGSFRDYVFAVDAPQYESKRFSVRLNATVQTREVVLDPAWGKLRVFGPPGARIEVVNKDGRRFFLETIGESGQWESEERLLSQRYDFIVTKDGFATESFDKVELTPKEWVELKAELDPLPATLRVLSEPDGAEVRVGGKRVGRTPLVYEEIPPTGVLTVEVTGNGFRARSQEIEIQPGQENVVDFGNLEAKTGTLQLGVLLRGRAPTADDLKQLEVVLDGEQYGAVARLNRGLPAGPHTIEVSHPDYFPLSRSVSLSDNETVETELNLSPRPGKIELILPPARFRALVDGEPATLVENIVGIPAEKEVELTLVVKDYLPVARKFYHAPNSFETWEPNLVRLPGPSIGSDWKIPYLNETLVWVPRGSFLMGSPGEEQLRLPNEGPQTRVRLDEGFWIGQTEVTQEFYERVLGENPSEFRGDKRPVENVSWRDAQRFATKLTEMEREAGRLLDGYEYRLPTEAEWEYAARAGTSTPFSFGGEADPSDGNFEGQYPRDYGSTEIRSEGEYGTEAVASYAPNAWGIYDVHGNVREWIYDGYNDRLLGGETTDPVRLEEGRGRGVRGGGWDEFANRVRSSAREYVKPTNSRSNLGFRIVLGRVLE
jgi:formylglycine-generating enzyme required for sulfatase activity/serine/threonine protein kinase